MSYTLDTLGDLGPQSLVYSHPCGFAGLQQEGEDTLKK